MQKINVIEYLPKIMTELEKGILVKVVCYFGVSLLLYGVKGLRLLKFMNFIKIFYTHFQDFHHSKFYLNK